MRNFKTTVYNKVIAINEEHLRFIDTTRSRKSKAGRLAEIIDYFITSQDKPLPKKQHTNHTKYTKYVEKVATPGIQEVMNAFYEINPGLNFGNKTQRAAAEWLLHKYGLEKTLATVKYIESIQSEKYAPVITTPLQLKENMGRLIAFHSKKTNNPTIVSI